MSHPSFFIHQEIQSELPYADIYVSDADYDIPSSEWLEGKFYRLFKNWLQSHGAYVWKKYHDCDNKAGGFKFFTDLCHFKTMEAHEREGEPIAQGISVGVVWYMINGDKKRGHAINIMYTDRGLRFMEPQNGRWMSLTKKEKESAWMVEI